MPFDSAMQRTEYPVGFEPGEHSRCWFGYDQLGFCFREKRGTTVVSMRASDASGAYSFRKNHFSKRPEESNKRAAWRWRFHSPRNSVAWVWCEVTQAGYPCHVA